MLRYASLVTILVSLGSLLGGCSRDADVVLYVSADEHVARQVIDAFEKKTGLRVLMVGDTEVKKTTGLVERLRAEKDNPRADVFWSSEVFMTIELAQEELFEPYSSGVTQELPRQFSDPENRWHGFAARARVIVFSPARVYVEETPKTWMDLTKSAFKGRIVMADPRFGTTGGHLGAMKAYWDREVMPGYFAAWAEGLAENNVRMLPSGNAGVVDAIVKGEADIGLTDTDDVWAAQAQGHLVRAIYPAHSVEEGATGIGTLLIPNTVAIIKGGPNPENAKRLLDFLASADVERILAESVSHNLPLREAVAKDFPQFAIDDVLKVDYPLAAATRQGAVAQFMRIVREEEEPAP